MNSVRKQIGKDPGQPGATSEDVMAGRDAPAAGSGNTFQLAFAPWRLYCILKILGAALSRFVGHGLHRTARDQRSAVQLKQGPGNPLQSDLRVTLSNFGRR